MSKVYSFRLDENNPREAQAMRVIDAWVEEGYSLRYVIVDALVTYKKDEMKLDEPNYLIEQLKDLIQSLDQGLTPSHSKDTLSNSFMDSVKQTVRLGLTLEEISNS